MVVSASAETARLPERSARSLTVEKALQLLDVVAQQGAAISLVPLSRAAGLDKTTTHRLATSLARCGLLRFDPTMRSYSLGLRLADLGHRAIEQIKLPPEARPYLLGLGGLSGEAVNLGVFDEGQVVFIDQVASPQQVVIRARVGSRVPAHCTAMGKTLLAFGSPEWREKVLANGLSALTPNTIVHVDEFREHLARVRRAGYGSDDEEHRLGIRCIAAPVRDYTGLAVAAMSISGPAFRLSRERATELVEPLKQAAAELSAVLGYGGAGTAVLGSRGGAPV